MNIPDFKPTQNEITEFLKVNYVYVKRYLPFMTFEEYISMHEKIDPIILRHLNEKGENG